MKFDAIQLTGGQVLPDPRTTPGSVPLAAVRCTPATLTQTDNLSSVVVLALEGTAGQTAQIERYVQAETPQNLLQADSPKSLLTDRRFYKVPGGPLTITVGEVKEAPSYPGQVYYRVTTAPAANATLLIGYRSGTPAP